MSLKLLEDRDKGLIDVKVSIDPNVSKETSVEDIFQQMDRIKEAHERGETTPYYDF